LTALDVLLRQGREVTVILVMRNDYYGVLTSKELPELNSLLGYRILNVSKTVAKNEMEDIVREPARTVGYAIADDLVKQIVAEAPEVSKEGRRAGVGLSSALPLLEVALEGLWEKREEGVLTRAGYDSSGGVSRALAQRAEDAYKALGQQQPLARR